jgi:hypothetical protein
VTVEAKEFTAMTFRNWPKKTAANLRFHADQVAARKAWATASSTRWWYTAGDEICKFTDK